MSITFSFLFDYHLKKLFGFMILRLMKLFFSKEKWSSRANWPLYLLTFAWMCSLSSFFFSFINHKSAKKNLSQWLHVSSQTQIILVLLESEFSSWFGAVLFSFYKFILLFTHHFLASPNPKECWRLRWQYEKWESSDSILGANSRVHSMETHVHGHGGGRGIWEYIFKLCISATHCERVKVVRPKHGQLPDQTTYGRDVSITR